MRSRQTGITFIGWIVLLAPLAVIAFAVIKLTPVYLNYMKVAKTLEQVASNYQGDNVNPQNVRRDIQNRFDVEDVDYPEVKDIAVTRDGDRWVLEAAYEDSASLFAGISILVNFDKRVVVQ
jgi:hypothetical protein